MSELLYFAYGSNLHPLWLKSRTPSAEIVSVETLVGFSLSFNKHGLDDSGKCNITETSQDDHVLGAVYRFQAEEKAVLDEAERGYQEHSIAVGAHENVLIYIADDPVEDYSSPYSWYQDIVLAGAGLHGFPDPYLQHIRAFTAKPDPDSARDLRHRTIVELL